MTSATTLIEAWHPRVDRARFAWSLSRLVVEPVTETIAKTASSLLSDAGLHGHKYALDAALCAVALNQQRPAVVLTSDPDDISRLGGKALRVVRV
nr:hypothetical protein [Micromonospora sp. DSM 115978]